jgi:hypothetical protein
MALAEERALPSGVMGPRERAAWAREALIRLSELIAPLYIGYHGGGAEDDVSRLFSVNH